MRSLGARSRREATRFLKFSVVGAIGAVVDFGTFNLLTIAARLPGLPSSGLSFSAAVVSNFLWNRYWTYPDSRAKPVGRQAVQFTLVNLVGLAVRTPIFAFSEAPLIALFQRALGSGRLAVGPWLILEPAVLGRNLALALAVVVVLFWNFAANRWWTYSDAP